MSAIAVRFVFNVRKALMLSKNLRNVSKRFRRGDRQNTAIFPAPAITTIAKDHHASL